jgi:hypothetical protein
VVLEDTTKVCFLCTIGPIEAKIHQNQSIKICSQILFGFPHILKQVGHNNKNKNTGTTTSSRLRPSPSNFFNSLFLFQDWFVRTRSVLHAGNDLP